MRTVFSLLLVLPAVVYCCDPSTHYVENDKCCKMCGPGTRMKQRTDCTDPNCEMCGTGEYQASYTKEFKCQQQPFCDPNLNFKIQTNPSTTQLISCECIPDHHCSSQECISCVKNTVCKPGQQVKTLGTLKSDTVCEPCPNGTFSITHTMKCQPWTSCPSGHFESVPGTQTSDRSCELHSNIRLGVGIVILLVVVVLMILGAYYCYRKGKTGSACLEEKFQQHCSAFLHGKNNNQHQPVEDKATTENELLQPINASQPHNEPQEDNEDKQDDHFKKGLSANGMPVDQDHSKMSFISQAPTSAESLMDRL
ncbi:hypothetical protein NFI96_017454 [Prochilodus magdalenae]|nr:hypothetical protein NFI96_017454 [Prochilodus magdalenae]